MLSRRNSINFSFERVASYIERVSKNPFLNLGIGLFITISTISSWNTWYATINNGKVELHHGITVAGIWQVLASLPDVFRSLYRIYFRLKTRKRRKSKVKVTLLETMQLIMDIGKVIVKLHRANVRQEIVEEVHNFVKNLKDIVDGHGNALDDTDDTTDDAQQPEEESDGN